jgi:pseudouridine-5'-phosphate glycosidase
MRDLVLLAGEVAEALAARRPVVALESSILAQGMPYPENIATARAVEAAVREAGAVPATIAVLDGRIRVGLSPAELERIGTSRTALKLSRADLAYALAQRRDGGTTVAATMIAAHLAGIAIFATGGIGGVHRGAETSGDVSTDLEELARTPVTVVAAGAKAILDLPKTLEMLETKGVPVIGYGTDELPAFWSRSSGLKAPLRLDTPAEVAALIAMQRRLGVAAGILVANPIPVADEIPAAVLTPAIAAAVEEAARQGIVGKAVTPFLLDRIVVATGGRSLAANMALVRNNARVAAEIAVALAAQGPIATGGGVQTED